MRLAAREAIAVAAALGSYRLTVVPPLRRELGRWEAIASEVPDQVLRDQALAALRAKASNVEAIGVFATLAPRRHRATALRAMVALQVAIDYLDTLTEGGGGSLEDALALHRALPLALTPGATDEDWYRLHPRSADGGYLSALVAACRESVERLPSAAEALPPARRAAERCGEGQARTHLAAGKGPAALEEWAAGLGPPAGYRWWEIAAGASSSVAAHALIAAAAGPGASAEQARLTDAAYFPGIGALTVLLDDLVDREQDSLAGEHSYLDYYAGPEDAGDRLASIATHAMGAVAELPRRRRHAAILAGVAGFYLSTPEAEAPFAAPIAARLLATLGPQVRLIVAFMHLRRGGSERKRPGGAWRASGP